jgi:hypothetical protein
MSWAREARAPVNVAADAVALQRRLIAAGNASPTVAVIGPKALADAIRAMQLPGIEVAHNQALRGRDHLKGCDGLVIAGRNMLPTPEAEGIARALWPHERLLLSENMRYRRDVLRMVDGSTVGTRSLSHPDPRVDAVLRLTSGGELEQGIARLRAIHVDRHRIARVLTSHPLRGVALSKVIEGDPFMGWAAARLLTALARSGGELPLVAKGLAARFPELWVDAKHPARAVEDVVRDGVPELERRGLVETVPLVTKGKRGRRARLLRWRSL